VIQIITLITIEYDRKYYNDTYIILENMCTLIINIIKLTNAHRLLIKISLSIHNIEFGKLILNDNLVSNTICND